MSDDEERWPKKVTHDELPYVVDGYDHREAEYHRPELKGATFHLVKRFPLAAHGGVAISPKALTDDMEFDSRSERAEELANNKGLREAMKFAPHSVPPIIVQKHHDDPMLDGAHRKALGLHAGVTHHPAYVTDAKPTQRKQAALDGPDWCAHRRQARCFYPGDRLPDGTRLGIPQDRGPCLWNTILTQQICPISEPGPEAVNFRTGALAPDETPSARIFGPTHGLDHRLFEHEHLKPAVRDDLMRKWYEFCEAQGLYDSDEWSIVYFAGSEASEWTSANREGNNDFDILVGVDLHLFASGGYGEARMRRAEQLGWEPTQAGIAAGITDKLKSTPGMVDPHYRVPGDDSDWDQTWYCNSGSYRIQDIKPYAAYDVTHDRWAVKPPHLPGWSMKDFPEGPGLEEFCWGFEHLVRATLEMPEPYRHQEGYALWHYVHDERALAFGPQGEGWWDLRNVLEKWLDAKGLMQELWTLMHEAIEDPHLLDAPADWSNTPVLSMLMKHADWTLVR